MDWSQLLKTALIKAHNITKSTIPRDINISKVIFTGSAIAMVSIVIASSYMGGPPNPKNPSGDKEESLSEEEKSKKTKKEKKRRRFVLKDRHFLTEEEEELSDFSTTANGDSSSRGNNRKFARRNFASDYEGDDRFTNRISARHHSRKKVVKRDEADDLYFMMFDKLNSDE